MSNYSDQDQFHAGPGQLDKFPADAWSTGVAKQNINMDASTKKFVFATIAAGLWLAMMYWLVTDQQTEKAQRGSAASLMVDDFASNKKARAEREAAAAKWRVDHPDGRAKDLEDLKGASEDDVWRNRDLVFARPTPEEVQQAKARKAERAAKQLN